MPAGKITKARIDELDEISNHTGEREGIEPLSRFHNEPAKVVESKIQALLDVVEAIIHSSKTKRNEPTKSASLTPSLCTGSLDQYLS